MTRITFGYSDSEDRVWLSSSDGARYWLTRRLLARLLRPVTDMLEKTVPGGDIPHALPPGSRVALEHEAALADGPEGLPPVQTNTETRAPGTAPGKPPALVTEVTCQADGRRCALIITAGGEPKRIEMNRADLHRTLSALHRITVKAGWGLAGLPDWLAD
jgi:hypothetical protein